MDRGRGRGRGYPRRRYYEDRDRLRQRFDEKQVFCKHACFRDRKNLKISLPESTEWK